MPDQRDNKAHLDAVAALKPSLPLPLTIMGLEPSSAHIGDPALEVHVLGTGFTVNSLITVERANLTTVFHSDSDISALVNSSDRTVPGMVLVTVKNGSEESNSLGFTILPPLSDEQKAEMAKEKEAKAKEMKPPSRPTVPQPPPQTEERAHPHNPENAQSQRHPEHTEKPSHTQTPKSRR